MQKITGLWGWVLVCLPVETLVYSLEEPWCLVSQLLRTCTHKTGPTNMKWREASHIWYWHRGEIQSCKLTFTNPGLATSTHFTTTVAGEKRVGQRKQDREAGNGRDWYRAECDRAMEGHDSIPIPSLHKPENETTNAQDRLYKLERYLPSNLICLRTACMTVS